jgi:leucine dehydrogenase
MQTFELIEQQDHEQVVFCSNRLVGLQAIIAIHDTSLGPALGGTRMWTYKTSDEALKDVLRLSRGMTYKASVAGLNLGGGKAVIIGDPNKDKSEDIFRVFGRFVEGLAGRYITAEDVGTDVKDMEYVRMETKYVTGISRALGGSGDPSPVTAYGVYVGMKACAHEVFGNDSLKGKKIAVQGAGNVARYLCQHLQKEGAHILVCDIYPEKVKAVADATGAEVIDPEKIYDADADIFAPCALGGIINDETLKKFKFKIIAGGANNQLLDENKHAKALQEKGILYAPDYAINAGGLINVANEFEGYNQERALNQAETIYTRIQQILSISKEHKITTHEAASRLAEDRIRSISQVKQIYAGASNFTGRLSETATRR